MVRAKIITDTDHCFDATEWFEQATNEELLALCECEFGGDYPADVVAEYFDGLDPDITTAFALKEGHFDCRINPHSALMWLRDNRPNVYQEAKGLTVWATDNDEYDPDLIPEE